MIRVRLTLRRLRLGFDRHFSGLGYSRFVEDSILANRDTGLLFVNSGIVAIKHEIEGADSGRLFSLQGCLRLSGKHNDLEEVGLSRRHHTYFEMAGHFVWGECLTKTLYHAIDFLYKCNIKPEELLVTYHPKHSFALSQVNRWVESGFEVREDTENTWSSGEHGYQGYCVELYLRRDARGNEEDLELWNCVFVDRWVDLDGHVSDLDKKFLDSGMGIARLASVIEGHFDTYKNSDLLLPQRHLGLIKGLSEQERRVLSDHMRSVVYMLNSDIRIDNKEAGYVLKKLLRKMFVILALAGQDKDDSYWESFLLKWLYCYVPNSVFGLNNRFEINKIRINELISEFRKWSNLWTKQLVYLNDLNAPLGERDVARLIAEKGFNKELLRRCTLLIKGFDWSLCDRIIKEDF